MPQENFKIINQKKILVVSDSHCWLTGLTSIIEKEKPTTLIHLGDLIDKGGDETNKRDFELLIKILRKNPELYFVHVSGGEDSYGPFDIYTQQRENSISTGTYKEGNFLLCHDIHPRTNDGLDLDNIENSVLDYIKRSQHKPLIILHGHTHRQRLAVFEEGIKNIDFEKGKAVFLQNSNYLINPGAFSDNEYCIIEKEKFYSVRFL